MYETMGACELPLTLRQRYAISRKLGAGACGEVRLLFTKDGSKKFAVKIIQKNYFCTGNGNILNNPANVRNEVEILRKLKHVSSDILVTSFLCCCLNANEIFISALYNSYGGHP